MTDRRFWSSVQQRFELNGSDNRRHGIGFRTCVQRNIYQNMRVHLNGVWDHQSDLQHQRPFAPSSSSISQAHNRFPGAIYNVSFSPNGSLLAAGTRNHCILLFDPLSHKLVHRKEEAHSDGVNNIKFLDDHMFASCSDDTTIALWDIRMMSQRLKSLKSHTYWVKNIEYLTGRRTLITSGYDGVVNAWNIAKDTNTSSSINSSGSGLNSHLFSDHLIPRPGDHPDEPSCPHKQILSLSCLMRMKVTNDETKMLICTSEGYILIIHDLNIDTLAQDLKNFQSDLYRLMQKGHSFGYDFGSWHNSLFQAKRNRIELISDFPDESHELSSLDVHPSGWCMLSRGITRNDDAEYTVVHDIQSDVRPHKLIPLLLPKDKTIHSYSVPRHSRTITISQNHMLPYVPPYPLGPHRGVGSGPGASSSGQVNISDDAVAQVIREEEEEEEDNYPISPVVIISARTMNRRAHATILNPEHSYRLIRESQSPPMIYENVKRMTHYVKEANVAHGYIKEVNFSPDGRVVVSPYESGFRILAFNETCDEMNLQMMSQNSDSNDQNFSRPLHEVNRFSPHLQNVLTTRFSPTHPIIASGCLGGRIVFTQPMLQ